MTKVISRSHCCARLAWPSVPRQSSPGGPRSRGQSTRIFFRPLALAGRPDGSICCLAFDAGAPKLVVGTTLGGGLFVSDDWGRTALSQHAWRAMAPAAELHGRAPLLLALSSRPKIVYLAKGRFLAKSADLGATWDTLRGPDRPIVAMTARSNGTLTVVAADGSGAELLTSSDGVSWFAETLLLPLPLAGGDRVWLARSDTALAIGQSDAVAVSRDSGRRFAPVAGCTGTAAGVFAGDGATAPLVVALIRSQEHSGLLVKVDRDDRCEIIARISGHAEEDQERGSNGPALPVALGWDGGYVWGAGAFGLAAWAPPGAAARTRAGH